MNNLIKNEFKEDLLYGGEYISAGTCEFYQALIGFGAGGTAAASYVIENSARFNDDDTASLSRTFVTGDNTHKGGFSWWFKRSNITQFSELCSSSDGGERIYIIDTDFLTIQLANGSQVSTSLLKLRDPTAWYNVVVSVDGTASGDNRLLAWLNGVPIALSSNDPGATPFSGGFNGNEVHYWFKNPGGSGDRYHFDGYQAETVFIDGTIAPTDVGEYDSNGNWVPIDVSGLTYGTNGFHLDYSIAPGTDYGAGTDVSKGPGFIHRGEGTAIGNLVVHGGLAGGFNGIYNETTAGAALAAGTGYIGKTWASAKTITGFYIESYSNKGFVEGATPEITCNVYGKTGSAPSSSTDGTSLFEETKTDGDDALLTFQSAAITAASYLHIWVRITSSGGNVHVGEVEFYENNATIGRRNHFTETGLAANDKVSDSPTDSADDGIGNYATLNPLSVEGTVTFSNGNLKVAGAANSYSMYLSTMPIKVKTYFEVTNDGDSSANGVRGSAGVWDSSGLTFTELTTSIGSRDNVYGLSEADQAYADKVTGTDYSGTWDSGETRGFAVDPDTGEMWVTTDGGSNWLGGSSPGNGTPTVDFSAATGDIFATGIGYTTTDIQSWNFGQLGFAGTVPTGYKALNTANLPAPAIKDSTKYFQTKLFAGGGTAIGSGGDAVVFGENSTMQPDLVWIKDRDATSQNVFTDSVRGVTKELVGEDATAETTVAEGLNSFNADGFTLGNDAAYNTSSSPQVAWSWKKGAVPGFGINSGISHTKSTPTNIAHDLGAVPEFALVKATSASGGWYVYHQNLTSKVNNHCFLDTTAGIVALTDAWGAHTSTNLIIDELPSATYVAYSWVGIDGFSKFGTHEGNGAADGSFVYLGFRPAFVLFWSLDSTCNKQLFDNKRLGYNVENHVINVDAGTGEDDQNEIDFLSNGFKLRVTGDPNIAETYIWAAFAEAPFGGSGVSQARAR